MAQWRDKEVRGLSRAEFLRHLAGAALLMGSGPLPALAANPKMMTRPIPKSGEALPIVGLGTWKTFGVGLNDEERTRLTEVLRILFDAGGSVIDSSPQYGRSEAVVGTLLANMGAVDRAFMATKVWTEGRQAGIAQMEASERKLQDPRIELMQVHNLIDTETHLKTLRAWKEQGRIKYIGVTHYKPEAFDELEQVMKAHDLDFVQLPYSMAFRDADRRLLPLAADLGMATLINIPFATGKVFRKVKRRKLPRWATDIGCRSWGQFFLMFLLGHPAVTCVIPGTSKPKHIRDNVQAGMGRLPDAAERRKMSNLWDGMVID